eukprot:6578396-Alexandrium_andersonii.AAC.1
MGAQVLDFAEHVVAEPNVLCSADSSGGPTPTFQISMTSTNTHVSAQFLIRICGRLGWDLGECMAPLLLQSGAL